MSECRLGGAMYKSPPAEVESQVQQVVGIELFFLEWAAVELGSVLRTDRAKALYLQSHD